MYIMPTYDHITATNVQVSDYTQALAKAREVDELKRALIAKYNQFNPKNIDRLKKFLPDHVDNVRLVLDLDGIASRHGLRIGNVAARKEGDKVGTKTADDTIGIDTAVTDARSYKSLILEFTVTASYQDYIAFIRDIEQSLRLVDMVGLTMEATESASPLTTPLELRALGGTSPDPSQNINPVYRFTTDIRTYWLP
jgi:Tfp pilus assembly protein PilO